MYDDIKLPAFNFKRLFTEKHKFSSLKYIKFLRKCWNKVLNILLNLRFIDAWKKWQAYEKKSAGIPPWWAAL